MRYWHSRNLHFVLRWSETPSKFTHFVNFEVENATLPFESRINLINYASTYEQFCTCFVIISCRNWCKIICNRNWYNLEPVAVRCNEAWGIDHGPYEIEKAYMRRKKIKWWRTKIIYGILGTQDGLLFRARSNSLRTSLTDR